MKLFEAFSSQNEAEWLSLIKKELKGGSLSDVAIDLSPEIAISPFQHFNEAQPSVILPPPTFLTPKLGLELTINEEEKANQLILESLLGGVSYLSLNAKEVAPDYSALLKDVIPEYIHLRIDIQNKDHMDRWDNYKQQLAEPLTDQIICTGKDGPFSASFDSAAIDLRSFNNSDDLLHHFLIKAHDLLLNKDQTTILIEINFGCDYASNICLIRALRLLWANLLTVHQPELKTCRLIIEGHVHPEALSTDKNDSMIILSYIAMCMMSAGVDVLFIPPSNCLRQPEGSEFTRRISRNIFHLMTLEGQLDKVVDPASGSYFFDRATTVLARTAWQHFIEESNE